VRVRLGRADESEGAGEVEGRIAEISRAVDAASHAFLVKIDLRASDLKSGLFAQARFTGAARSALAVPDTTLVRRGQLTTVFVVTNQQQARMRVVRIGQSDQGFVEIVAGLGAGDEVIITPPPALRDGDTVRRSSRALPSKIGGP
jgi:multidrug efflux pump subunit AcrA (membrane-fusion protein)